MSEGPTTGAVEKDARAWHASPVVAFSIRCVAFLLPLLTSFLVLRGVGRFFIRPEGGWGMFLWVVQAVAVSVVVSVAVDRYSRRLLPLAALFGMSLVFPDEAPSRFSVALRAGTVSKLRAGAAGVRPISASMDAGEAAAEALALVTQLGRHDRLTRGHTERVRAYSDLIGEEMGLSPDERTRLSWAGLLHDVGKLAVPAEVLNKDGRPTDEEWATLRNHPAAAVGLLGPLADWLGEWVLAASEHHERWDGNGYPLGLKGTEISLAGRIVAAADAYDVITSRRSYKGAMSPEAGRRELLSCSGTQFDPQVIRAFLNVSIGRRWLAGPFAWLAELPLGLGGAVARVPAIAAATAVAVTATTVPLIPDTTLAFSTQTETTSTSTTSEAALSPPPSNDPASRPVPTSTETGGGSPPSSTTPTTRAGGQGGSATTTSTPGASTMPDASTTMMTIPDGPLSIPILPTVTVTTPAGVGSLPTLPTTAVSVTTRNTAGPATTTTITTQSATSTTQATTSTTTTTQCNSIVVLGVRICL